MADFSKDVIKIILQNNCVFVRHGKGDHDIYYSEITKRHFTVDNKIKSRHTANAIMKQSGVKFKFQDENMILENKIVAITGGSKGFGKALAKAFCAEGANNCR